MNKPLILVVEDDTPVRNLITMTLKTHEYRYLSAQNGASAVMEALSHNPDIVLLDLGLPDMDGIQTARELRRQNCTAQIIFLTSYPGYVFDAFDVRPLQYLLKAKTGPEQLETVFLEAVQAAEADQHASFLVKTRDSLVRVPLRDIFYLESLRNRIIVHCGNREYSYIGSLEAACGMLAGHRFLRISRCYLINPQKFSQLMDTSLLLIDGTALQISRRYKKSVKEFLRNYYEQLPASSAQG